MANENLQSEVSIAPVTSTVEPKIDNTQVSNSTTSTTSPDTTVNPVSTPPVSEKVLPQSKVDQIVKTAKIDSYNKGKNEALEEIKNRYSQVPAQDTQSVNTMNQQNSLSKEDVERLIEQKAQEKIRMEMANKVANDLVQKLQSKKEEGKYQDFDDVIQSLDLVKLASTAPYLVEWANAMDNTAEILYELGKHPSKYANLSVLALTAPNLAIKELQSLSSSIKQNETSQPNVKEPLSQIKSSMTGMDNGAMGIAEFKKQSWARG